MKFFKTLFALPLLLLATGNLSAANPYVDCGIGGAMFPNTPWAAAISNATWDAGTTAVISATASPDTCNNGAVQTAQLIHDKYELLESDIIMGSGESYAALTGLMNCSADSMLLASIKQDVISIITEPSYSSKPRIEKSIDLYSALQANKSVNSACAAQL